MHWTGRDNSRLENTAFANHLTCKFTDSQEGRLHSHPESFHLWLNEPNPGCNALLLPQSAPHAIHPAVQSIGNALKLLCLHQSISQLLENVTEQRVEFLPVLLEVLDSRVQLVSRLPLLTLPG